MKKMLVVLIAAFGIQFLLMHSFSALARHWAWVSGGSLALFTVWDRILAVRRRYERGALLLAGISLCAAVPTVIYLTLEFLQSPTGMLNSLSQHGLFPVLMLIFLSGGWAYGAALLLCQRWRQP